MLTTVLTTGEREALQAVLRDATKMSIYIVPGGRFESVVAAIIETRLTARIGAEGRFLETPDLLPDLLPDSPGAD